MATTTNYGWTTPDDTALVKDGAAAIRTLGSSVDTTTKALNPSTTLGDIEYRSSTANTNTRLGIGTTGQILTVAGGVPSWGAAPASGSMTLLETLTLSGASVTSSSIAGTYKNLYVVVKNLKPANDGDGCYVRFNSDSNANRYLIGNSSTSITGSAFTGDWLNLSVGTDNTTATGLTAATIYDYANTTIWKMMIVDSMQNNATNATQVNYRRYNGFYNQTGAITTLQFLPDSGNFTSGSILIYGVN